MSEKQEIGIAILDNGIDENVLMLCGLSNVIQYNKEGVDNKKDLFLHGTNCAIIIGLNCANAELYSYKILDNVGKGSVTALKAAFEWCLLNNIKLTNLSFGTTHFRDKSRIRKIVNHYAHKGLIIVAATANSGYKAFPASVSSVIGVRSGEVFGIDDKSQQEMGIDFVAPSEHTFQLVDQKITLQKSNSYAAPYVTAIIGQILKEEQEANVWQIKRRLYKKYGKECVQYVPDWIEKGWISGKVLSGKADVYFETVEKVEDADTVILYDLSELEKYHNKHIVYLGRGVTKEPDTQYFFWSRENRERQIICAKEKKENTNIPVLVLKFFDEQDIIWWLTELRKHFETDGYNAYTVSSKVESVLYDLEYIPLDVDDSIRNKISDYIYWQTYYNQSDLIICGIKESEKENFDECADILIEIGNKGEKPDIWFCCDGTKAYFETIGEQQTEELYKHLIQFLTEEKDE